MSLFKIRDLFGRIDLRSSMLVLPDIDEVLSIFGTVKPHVSRIELMTKSLEKFTHQYPLIRLSKIQVDSSEWKFPEDTFEAYCLGSDPQPDYVIMTPSRIISMNGTIFGSRRNWILQDGILYYHPGSYIMNAVYDRRPIYVKYGTDDLVDEKSAIGFIEKRHETILVDQCLLDLLEYFVQLKKNFNYPDLPITLFDGLDEKISDLRQELEYQYANLTHGKLYR